MEGPGWGFVGGGRRRDDGEGATAPPRRSEKTRGLPTRSARARRRTEHIVSPEGGDAEVEVVLELGGALGHEVGDVGGVDVAKVLLVVGEEGRDVSVHEGLAGALAHDLMASDASSISLRFRPLIPASTNACCVACASA